jgi:hypothetical protein
MGTEAVFFLVVVGWDPFEVALCVDPTGTIPRRRGRRDFAGWRWQDINHKELEHESSE